MPLVSEQSSWEKHEWMATLRMAWIVNKQNNFADDGDLIASSFFDALETTLFSHAFQRSLLLFFSLSASFDRNHHHHHPVQCQLLLFPSIHASPTGRVTSHNRVYYFIDIASDDSGVRRVWKLLQLNASLPHSSITSKHTSCIARGIEPLNSCLGSLTITMRN